MEESSGQGGQQVGSCMELPWGRDGNGRAYTTELCGVDPGAGGRWEWKSGSDLDVSVHHEPRGAFVEQGGGGSEIAQRGH